MNSINYNFVGLNKSYASKTVINDVRIKIRDSQCTLLIGENGAGKTTLLKMISGLEKPDSGIIYINQKNYSWKQCKSILVQNIMYLHQQPYMFDGSVKNNLQYTLNVSNQRSHSIDEAIEWASLEAISGQNANSLSGGEKQRVAIARAFLRNPQVVLLDEPTANLDQTSKKLTLELLQQLKNRGIAVVIASHDPQLFYPIQDEQLQLKNSKMTNLNPRKRSKDTNNSVTDINQYKTGNM